MPPKKPKKELIDLYLRFRWLIGSLKDLPSAELLSTPNTEALLAEIVQAWRSGSPHPVHKLLVRTELGHFNTIRKRIHELESAGFVEFRDRAGDSRVKLVVPTDKALGYLASYAEVIRGLSK